jgi:hypothetical protein
MEAGVNSRLAMVSLAKSRKYFIYASVPFAHTERDLSFCPIIHEFSIFSTQAGNQQLIEVEIVGECIPPATRMFWSGQ